VKSIRVDGTMLSDEPEHKPAKPPDKKPKPVEVDGTVLSP